VDQDVLADDGFFGQQHAGALDERLAVAHLDAGDILVDVLHDLARRGQAHRRSLLV
jgi:hypothetical protein